MATIGTQVTSGTPTNTIYYDSLMSTTLAAYRKTMIDNIFKDSAFLSYLRMKGAVKKQNGGQRVVIPLMYGANSTIKTHGGYSVIDTTPQEGITQAEYDWAEIAGSITISRKEERQNSGEGMIINLLESKIKQAEMSMREKLNGDLILGTISATCFGPDKAEDGSYGLLPLGYFIPKLNATNPVAPFPTMIGNIGSAANSWWRAKTFSLNNQSTTGVSFTKNPSTWAGLAQALKSAYNYCGRGSGGAPNLVLFDQDSYENYEQSMDAKIRYSDTKMADLGFETIKLKGATCIWDEVVPDVYTGTAAITVGTAFFINTEFYGLMIDSETDIITTPFIEPENQTAKTARILFMGQAWCSNLRKLGGATGLLKAISS